MDDEKDHLFEWGKAQSVKPKSLAVPAELEFKGPVKFNGPEYDPDKDLDRLQSQIGRIYRLMRDSAWRTLGEIAEHTGDPEASISAQLRHLRKVRFGSHTVDRRRRGEEKSGLFEYKLTVNVE